MLALVGIDLLLDRAESHIGDLFYTLPNMQHLLLWHELLEAPETELVCVLKLPIVRGIFLDRVVCQMDEVVIDVASRKRFSRCSQVGFLEEVNCHRFSQQHPYPDIELALVNQERLLYIFLDNERTGV
jgi:hypothetical protein